MYRNLSYYVKSDGTVYEGVSDQWHDLASLQAVIGDLITDLKSDEFFKQFRDTFSFQDAEAHRTLESTRAALSRLKAASSIQEVITEIMTVLMQFNSCSLILKNQPMMLEDFSKSYVSVGVTERVRPLGARSY